MASDVAFHGEGGGLGRDQGLLCGEGVRGSASRGASLVVAGGHLDLTRSADDSLGRGAVRITQSIAWLATHHLPGQRARAGIGGLKGWSRETGRWDLLSAVTGR
jgi:hypothetical protein